jgi:hypothetical protein
MIPIAAVSAPTVATYLEPHQARARKSTGYEDLLGDTIERGFAAGLHELDALVAYLNTAGPPGPDGQAWTPASFEVELARLGACHHLWKTT